MQVAKVLSVELVENSEKLYKLQVLLPVSVLPGRSSVLPGGSSVDGLPFNAH